MTKTDLASPMAVTASCLAEVNSSALQATCYVFAGDLSPAIDALRNVIQCATIAISMLEPLQGGSLS